jgi:hypothetical protein
MSLLRSKGKKLLTGGTNKEERWKFLIGSYAPKFGDSENEKILLFLASNFKSELVRNTKKLWGSKVKFESYAQLDRFMKGFARKLRAYNMIYKGSGFKYFPFVLNTEFLWPDPKEFLSRTFDHKSRNT